MNLMNCRNCCALPILTAGIPIEFFTREAKNWENFKFCAILEWFFSDYLTNQTKNVPQFHKIFL